MATVNVKVAVRCRPMSGRETDRGCSNVVSVDGSSIFIENPTEAGKKKQFTFDHSYFWDVSQETVYTDLAAPILDKAFDGFNGTIFAYGQTGSGKTHSMMGVEEDLGVIPRLANSLFERVDSLASDTRKFMITCSYLEIYNEVIHDLLNPSERQLKIRQSEKMGIYVEGLAELVVKSAEEIEAYIQQGNSVRKVAETQMNARSSRSHSCFTVKIEQQITEDIGEVQRQTKLRSKLNLVDLAGSERANKTGATGDRLKEGAAINLSLSALGNVISVLAEGKPGAHIPYRNSKLTRLLQESLGGNSVTVMLAALSPADYNYDETLSTLLYANRAKSIKNATKKNEDVNQRIIRELRSEIDELRAQLERMQEGGTGGAATDGEAKDGGAVMTEEEQKKVHEMQRKIAELQMAKDSTWEERERLSKLYEEERKKNLESEDRVRGVMQGLKEETLHALKRLKALRAERTRLTKEFKAHRGRNDVLKAELEHDLGAYTHYSEEQEAGQDRTTELEGLLKGIEEKRKELLNLRTSLAAIKTRLKENDKEQEECRAEAAAKRMVVEGDEELRRKIEMEVHQKMAKQKEDFLEAALEEERVRLQRETAAEKDRLQRHFGNGVAKSAEREYELELRLLQETADKQLLLLQVEDMRRRHALALEELREEHAAELADRAREALTVVRDVTQSLQAEVVSRDLEIQRVSGHLQLATADIEHLFKENQSLKQKLAEEVAWEPGMQR